MARIEVKWLAHRVEVFETTESLEAVAARVKKVLTEKDILKSIVDLDKVAKDPA